MRTFLLALGLFAVGVVAPAEGAETAEAAKARRMVVSPRPGQVVHWHRVWLRVRSSRLSDRVRVRLNGRQVGGDFGFPRRGVRSLRASLSHGLRRGSNVLTVTVRPRRRAPRRATVRFVVRTRRHLIGAGRDRQVSVRGRVRIRGQVRGAAGSKLRWRLLGGPRRSPGRAAVAAAATPAASLSSVSGATADFRPLEPGQYTLRLTAGSGSQAAADTVTLDALPRNRLVPVQTMIRAAGVAGDNRGIRVGDNTYLLRDAGGARGADVSLQALVLDRKTLGFVSNTAYTRAQDFNQPLQALDQSKLVMIALQPDARAGEYQLDTALAQIGYPAYGVNLKSGMMSIIGVPGMKPGDADVNALFDGSGRPAPLNGYLTPDQHGNFGFVPSAHQEFNFAPKPSDPCSACDDNVGFRLRHLDSRTLAPAAHDGEIFQTHSRSASFSADAIRRLAAAIAAVPGDNVVMLESVSNRAPGEPGYRTPISPDAPTAATVALANAVASVGGTRNAFNRVARKSGSVASGGLTYALVGWKEAGESAGVEVAAGVDGAGEAPSLSVLVRPDRQSRMRPAASDGVPDSLSDLMLDEPTNTWPLSQACRRRSGMPDDDPGAGRALNALPGMTSAEVLSKLGSDPRATYPVQPYNKADWDGLADQIDKVQYADVPDSKRDQFTQPQFLAGRCQLTTELRWVGNVRDYLANLKSPIANSTVLTYADVQTIGDQVYKDTEQPDKETILHWLELVETLLELAGPLTEEVTSTIAGVMELGVWMSGADENGRPNPELPVEARKLGNELVEQMQDAAETYESLGDVIVTDSAKLAFVGVNGGCLATESTCPPGWSFSNADIAAAKTDIRRGVERVAYEELLPLGFSIYALNPERLDRAPDPRWYNCGAYPWGYYTPTAVSMATTAERLELDPEAGRDLWRLLVLALPGGANLTLHGTPPSDALLKRMFGAVEEGGLGMSPSRLMREATWDLWNGTTHPYSPRHDPGVDHCH